MSDGWKIVAVACCGLSVGGCCILSLLVLPLIIPVLEIHFGAKYRNQCPINPNIPIYLIVAGICQIVFFFFLLFTIFVLRCSAIGADAESAAALATCRRWTIFFFSIIFALPSLAWLVVVSVWVFGAKSTVQHDKPELNTYCHGTLYNFAFVIVIIECIGFVLRLAQVKYQLNLKTEDIPSGSPRIFL